MKRWILGSFLILGLAAPALGKTPSEAPVIDQTDERSARPGPAGGPAKSEVRTIHAPARAIARAPTPQAEAATAELAPAPAQPPEPSPGEQRLISFDFEDADLFGAAREPAEPEVPTLRAPAREMAEASAPLEDSPTVRLAQAGQAQPPERGPGKQRLISLDFKHADLTNLLRILAAESGKNLVAGEDVKGKITISLKDVTWEVALDTILETLGFRKIEKDNVIRIVSLEQLAKLEAAKAKADEAKLRAEAEIRTKIAEAKLKEQELKERTLAAEAARAEAEARGPLKEEMIRLSYGDPEEIVKTLIGILGIPPEGAAPVEPTALTGAPPGEEGQAAPALISASAEVLAKGITIRAHKPTNSIFIRHFEADLERIKKLIREELDVPLPQVKIAARMEILEREDLFAIGVRWGGANAGTVGTTSLVGQGFSPRTGAGTGSTAVGARNPNLTLGGLLPVDPSTGLPIGANLVNLPIGALLGGAAAAGTGGFAFGIIGRKININLALQALRTEGKTETLARPEIVTVENNKATMSLGEEIPFATTSLEGTKIEFKEALLKLEVTPTVIRERDITKIKMKVVVENNSRLPVTIDLGTAGAPPVIAKRKAETEVLVKEGEHLVIGGVTTSVTQNELRKVPLLGDIPLLGWLFKQKGSQDTGRELVIFITPTLVAATSGKAPRP